MYTFQGTWHFVETFYHARVIPPLSRVLLLLSEGDQTIYAFLSFNTHRVPLYKVLCLQTFDVKVYRWLVPLHAFSIVFIDDRVLP